MGNVSLHQFLVLYTWFPLAVLLLFFVLIARFYQKFSGNRTYFWWYGVAAALFGAMSVRYAGAGIVEGDVITDVIAFFAGIILLVLVFLLHRYMMAHGENNND